MVSICATPQCSAPFRHLRQGRLFVVDPTDRSNQAGRTSSRLKFFWLCEQCMPRFTLSVEPGARVSCASRSEAEPCHQG